MSSTAQQPPDQSTARSDQLTKVSIAVGFAVLCATYMLNAMDRQLFYPLLPDISKELGFTLAESGWLATGFTLGLALAGLPTGYLADRLSRKSIIMVSVLVYSLGTLAIPLSVGIADMSVYRLLSGVGEGVQATALYAIVGAFFFHRRSVAAGVIGVAFGAGVFLGPLVGTDIASGFGTWRAPFFLFASAGLVLCLLTALFVSRKLTEAVTGGSTDSAAVSYDHVPASPYNRNTLGVGIVSAVSGLVVYGYLGLYPTFLRESLGFTPEDAALAVSFFGFGAMMALPAGWLGDRMNQPRLLAFSLAATAVCTFFMYQVATTPSAQYVLSFLVGTFGSGFLFTNCATAMQRAVRPQHVGRGAGLFILFYYVAAAFSGLLFAQLVGLLGWDGAGLWQLTILPIVGIAAVALMQTSKMVLPRQATQ
jgi:MFS family permease